MEMEMFPIRKRHSGDRFAGPISGWIITVCLALTTSAIGHADELTLADAEAIALDQDPSLQAVESKREALEELAVASGQLPDPLLRTGFMSLPTDTWNLGQEPMTQVQVGVSQKFPRGRTRALRAEQMLEQSSALGDNLDDLRLRIALAVREDYLEVLKQRKLAEINAEAIEAFSDLADITQDYYATGRVQQQDVLRAAVELAKVEDRATRIAQEEDRARARLETWIGEAAYRDLQSDWPDPGAVPPPDVLEAGLAGHPRLAALQRQVAVADTGVELAEQRYKPEFGIDLTYGGRGGNNPDGSSRSDLFSVMVMMDLPLFHENRQDRYKAAALAESSAAAFNRDDMYRRMKSEAAVHAATLSRQLERMQLFENSLLPDAEFNAEATFSAYQAAVESLTTLMRARITEFELQLEYATLRAELLKTRARLLYLEGGAS
jgi:outer membrane protein TolC